MVRSRESHLPSIFWKVFLAVLKTQARIEILKERKAYDFFLVAVIPYFEPPLPNGRGSLNTQNLVLDRFLTQLPLQPLLQLRDPRTDFVVVHGFF